MNEGRSQAGIGSIETFIFVCIVSALTLVMLPSYLGYSRHKQATVLADNFRSYASAFRDYATEIGDWPSTAEPGAIPPEMHGRLPLHFTQGSIGESQWAWEAQTRWARAGISLLAAGLDKDIILELDGILDDGNPETGAMVSSGNRVTLLLGK